MSHKISKTSNKGYRRCEICRIQEANVKTPLFFANFPLNVDRCREWVRITGNEDLPNLPIEKLHTGKHLCGIHFKDTDLNKKRNRLKKHAVPCLNLTSSPLRDDQLSEFPLRVWRPSGGTAGVNEQHCYVPLVKDCIVKEDGHPVITIQKEPFPRAAVQKEVFLRAPIQEDVRLTKEGPFSWQKSNVVPCDTEEVVTPCQFIDDDVLLHDSMTRLVQGNFTENTIEELDELKCNLCENIIKGGFLYSCVQCPDFDLCGACEARGAHEMHYVLRSPRTKTINEVQLTLRLIGQALVTDSIVLLRDHSDSLKDEIKEEIVEAPQHENGKEFDPLSAENDLPELTTQTWKRKREDGPLSSEIDSPEPTIQESSLDDCSVTEVTESEEDEPPPKKAAPLKSLIKSTAYAHKTIARSKAVNKDNLSLSCTHNIRKDNLPLHNIEKPKRHAPASGISTQMPINIPKQPITVKCNPVTPLSLPKLSSQQIHKVDNLVSIETSKGQRIFFPITYPKNGINKYIQKNATQNTRNNIINKQSGLPNTLSNIIVNQSVMPNTPNNIIVKQSRTPITQNSTPVKQNRKPISRSK